MQSAATDVKGNLETQNKADTFPRKLFKFLRDVDIYNASHVASWAPDGRSFQIHNPSEFIAMTEPRWFSFNKYSSFQRQLNIYGFHPVRDGIKKNCYYHESFRWECDHLLHRIHRLPEKRGKKFPPSTKSTASDFHSSSQITSSRTSTAGADPTALQLTTNIANTEASNTADHISTNVNELIAALMNTHRTIPEAHGSRAAVANSTVHEAHLANQFRREFNYADSSAVEHRSTRRSMSQSISLIGNIPDLNNSGHFVNSPLTSSMSCEKAALAVLLQRGNPNAEESFSRLLQSMSPRYMSHHSINLPSLVPSQHIMGIMQDQAIPVASSLEAVQNTLELLHSLQNSAMLSSLLQLSQLPMQSTSIDTLVRIGSTGGSVQESHDISQFPLPNSSFCQQRTRHNSIIQSMPDAEIDVAQIMTSIANNQVVGSCNKNDDAFDDEDGKLPGNNRGGSHRNIIPTQPQQHDAVNSSTTSELLTIANNCLEIYRSTSMDL